MRGVLKSAYKIAGWSISPGGGAAGYGHHTARYAGLRLINELRPRLHLRIKKTKKGVEGFEPRHLSNISLAKSFTGASGLEL